MNIAVIDADLIGRNKHRFPNLACMKISGYYKGLGHTVELKLNYDDLEKYDKVFISKVFTDTPIREEVLNYGNVQYGGTGFFYDNAPNLPYEIEHHMPDYHLYDDFINSEIERGIGRNEFKDYLDTSIGFTTRGCFRKCEFCVNKKYNTAFAHSPVSEFLDPDRKYISLGDDNFLAFPGWREILKDLKATNKRFQFKQGLDIRLMTDEKAELFKDAKYYGDYIFAFDFIGDKEIIEKKLEVWRRHVTKSTKLYLFTGFDREDKYDDAFWRQDIIDLFERIKILHKYNCKPYVMRHMNYNNSPHKGIYIAIAAWANQPAFFRKMTFAEYCIKKGISNKVYHKYKDNHQQYIADGYNKGATWRYLEEFNKVHPDIVEKYFHLTFDKEMI